MLKLGKLTLIHSYLDILVSLVQGGGAVDSAVSAAAVAGVQNMVTHGAPPQQKRAYKALCALMQGDLQVCTCSFPPMLTPITG
jgi:hypothetical protein